MWRATVLTLFPEMFPGPLGISLIGKALEILDLDALNRSGHQLDAADITHTFTPGALPAVNGVQPGGNNGSFKSEFVWYATQKKGYVLLTNSEKGDDLDARLRTFFATGR